MDIRPQNMAQTSNFLLSPTKSMVARGNQWYPWTNSNILSKFQDYQPLITGIIPQNMAQTSNSLLSPTKSMVARATNGNQEQTLPSNSTFLHIIVPITPARATVRHCVPLPSNFDFFALNCPNHPSACHCAPLPSNLTFLHLIVPITPARATASQCVPLHATS